MASIIVKEAKTGTPSGEQLFKAATQTDYYFALLLRTSGPLSLSPVTAPWGRSWNNDLETAQVWALFRKPSTNTQELPLLSNICFSSIKGTVGMEQVPHLRNDSPCSDWRFSV